MTHINKQGYIAKGVKSNQNVFLVKVDANGPGIWIGKISLPKSCIGKRITFKAEVLEQLRI